jgi:hypothetical protein
LLSGGLPCKTRWIKIIDDFRIRVKWVGEGRRQAVFP